MWLTLLLPRAFSRAFAALPDLLLWEWADKNVWLENKEAAEAGPYRSAKTPWTRRIQELIQRPIMHHYNFRSEEWEAVPVNEINEIKSSQSGVSEAALNGIRYRAKYRPCNVIYAIDTREEAKNISERLMPSLAKLDADIFTGDDDDVGTYVVRLRAMDIWFMGSFSSGKFANKQAPLVIADELEEHGQSSKDTTTVKNLASRKKTAPNGLQINISKPKRKNGPIHKAFLRGNQEEFFVPCPHCNHLQWLTMFPEEDGEPGREVPFADFNDLIEITYARDPIMDEQTGEIVGYRERKTKLPKPLPLGQTRRVKTGRLVFEHCKDLLGNWDKLRIQRETYFECAECLGKIEEHHKPWMLSRGFHLPTAISGTPGVVSQAINDLYSTDAASAWGELVNEFLDAKKEGTTELQGFWNHRLGKVWVDELNKTEASDIRANIAGKRPGDTCAPYKRGIIPFAHTGFILGADVGGNYAKWSIGAVDSTMENIAFIDWGTEIDPDSIAEIMRNKRWKDRDGKSFALAAGFMDAKFRKTEALKACLAVPGRKLIPVSGGGAGSRNRRSVKVFSFVKVPDWKLSRLDFNDREALDEFYVTRIKKKKRRVWFPVDVEDDPEFVQELCAESLFVDEKGRTMWDENPPANHYGDTCKYVCLGLTFLTRRHLMEGEKKEGEDS